MRPRYAAMQRWCFAAGARILRYQVWDSVAGKFVGKQTRKRTSCNRIADKLNAEVLKQADAYRKAKDHG